MTRKKPLRPSEDKEFMLKLRENGKDNRQISTITGWSLETVRRLIGKEGRNPKGRPLGQERLHSAYIPKVDRDTPAMPYVAYKPIIRRDSDELYKGQRYD